MEFVDVFILCGDDCVRDAKLTLTIGQPGLGSLATLFGDPKDGAEFVDLEARSELHYAAPAFDDWLWRSRIAAA
ncbi:MAG: hypothetical protein ACXVXJ_11725 [Mycobacteriaceae bacterium]